MKTKMLLVVAVLLLILSYLVFNPIVIDGTTSTRLDLDLKVGDTVEPLSEFDFSKGDWKAFIVVNSGDNMLLSENGKVLVTNDRKLLEQIQEEWIFEYSGADVATVQSKFFLYNGNDLMFLSQIVADSSNNGLQTIEYGWLKSKDDQRFLSQCREFTKGYLPIYWFRN